MRAFRGMVVLCMLLAGCSSPRRGGEIAPLAPQDPEGIVILAVTQDSKPGSFLARSAVFLNGVRGKSDTADSQVLPSRERGPMMPVVVDYKPSEIEGFYGRVHALRLPAGTHSLLDWEIVFGTPARLVAAPRSKPVPLRIEVKRGEVLYLGNLHFNLVSVFPAFGPALITDGYPEIRDESARDIPLFEKRYPAMKGLARPGVLRTGPWIATPAGSKQIEPEKAVKPEPR